RWRSGGVRRASIWPYGGKPPEHVLDLRDRAAEPTSGGRSAAGEAHARTGSGAVVDLRARAAGEERP
ncbi:hypothetical protein, partial [Glycomyces dulcitolivorans]|uniref:hypothetical protein n=1 Tax=Glycomyces dulcitolivorans TaxID=2200759 RepID=UPI001300B0D5